VSEKSPKDRFIDMILDNGVALSLAVAFCCAVYVIMDRHNREQFTLFTNYIKQQDERRETVFTELLECLKN